MTSEEKKKKFIKDFELQLKLMEITVNQLPDQNFHIEDSIKEYFQRMIDELRRESKYVSLSNFETKEE